MLYLRQNSGTGAGSGATISIGPCLDSAGAEYTSLAIGDLTLVKNGTSAAMAANAALTHVSNGHYDLVTIGNNADTIGRGQIRCNKSGYQFPVFEFSVLHANVYDWLFGSTAPSVLTAAQAATALLTDLLSGSDFNTVGSFGKLIKDYLDAAVSSRLATGGYTAPDNSGISSAASAAAAAATAASSAATSASSAATSAASAATSAAAADTKAANIQTRLPAALVGGKMDATANATFSEEDKADVADACAHDVVDAITGVPMRVNSPFAAGDTLTVYAGDDYHTASGTGLPITITGLSAYIGFTVKCYLQSGVTIRDDTVITSGDEILRFEFTAAATATLTTSATHQNERGVYQLEIVDGAGRVQTTLEGTLHVRKKLS